MSIPYVKPAPPSDDKRWKIVATRMRRLGDRPEALIEALHAAQEAFGNLDMDALAAAKTLEAVRKVDMEWVKHRAACDDETQAQVDKAIAARRRALNGQKAIT